MLTYRDTECINHLWPRLRDFYLDLPFRVISARQELHGLSCATVATTSPPWAQTPAFYVHQAPTAHILVLGHPGPAQPMPIVKLVCVGASHPYPYSPTICLSSFTHSFQPLSVPTCTRSLCGCIRPSAFLPWPASSLLSHFPHCWPSLHLLTPWLPQGSWLKIQSHQPGSTGNSKASPCREG